MMRLLLLVLMCAFPALEGCQNKPPPLTLPTSYRGTLHGGMMAIGGETSGWVLVGEGEAKTVELDVSRHSDTARRLDGQRVIVSGRMTERNYVERGPVKILVVDHIAPVE